MPASYIGAELLDRVIAHRHARKSICSLQSVYFLLIQKYLIAFPSSVLNLLFSVCHYTAAVAKGGIWSLVSLVLSEEQDKMSGEISNPFLSGWDCNAF